MGLTHRILATSLLAGFIAAGGIVLLDFAFTDTINWLIELHGLDATTLETTP